jgi:hypothetical protein
VLAGVLLGLLKLTLGPRGANARYVERVSPICPERFRVHHRWLGALFAVTACAVWTGSGANASVVHAKGPARSVTYVYGMDSLGNLAPGLEANRLLAPYGHASLRFRHNGGRNGWYDFSNRVMTAQQFVATETGAGEAKPGQYTEGDLSNAVDGLTEAEKQAVRDKQAGNPFERKDWKSAKRKLDKTEKFNVERKVGKDRGQPKK